MSINDPLYGCDPVICGQACSLNNAIATCSSGACAVASCDQNYGNCDGNAADGCETVTQTDVNHCGACNIKCGANQTCNSGSCQNVLQSFSCSGWTRDPLFDAFKIGGLDVELVGGVWGSAGNDIYVPAATYGLGVIAHWTGASWIEEDLPGAPWQVHGIWGSSSNDIWLTARTASKAALFHKSGGVWTEDVLNEPFAKSFDDVWGADSNNVFVIGWKSVVGYRIWRKSGASWIDMNAPFPSNSVVMGQVWGLDANHVFVTGDHLNASSNADEGLLYYFSNNIWTKIQAPAGCVQLNVMSGTSLDDLFITGTDNVGAGIVYHVTNNMATWTPFVNPNIAGYGPIWSKYPGTFLASGYQPPGGDGTLRITTLDEMVPPATNLVDNMGYNPVKFWPEGNTTTVHLVNIASGAPAGHYVGTCN